MGEEEGYESYIGIIILKRVARLNQTVDAQNRRNLRGKRKAFCARFAHTKAYMKKRFLNNFNTKTQSKFCFL